MSAKPWTNEDLAGIRERQAHASTLLGWCPGSTAKWLVTLDAERAKSAELLETLRALVESLPRCDLHGDPATRAFKRGGRRYCDACNVGLWRAAPPYPRAIPLRAAVALLERLDAGGMT